MFAVAALVSPSGCCVKVTVKVWGVPTRFTALGAMLMNASTYRLIAGPLSPLLPSPVVRTRVAELGLAPGSASVIPPAAVAFAVMASTFVVLTVTVQVAVLPPLKDTDGPQVEPVCADGSLSVTWTLAVDAAVAPSGGGVAVPLKGV